jgi:hypothetical protein
VHRASGIPHALCSQGRNDQQTSDASRRENAKVWLYAGGFALSLVMRGLDPRIHQKRVSCLGAMDCRVKPGNDVG